MSLYALNLFDLEENDLYLRYSRRSPEAVARHGGRVVALGKLDEALEGASKTSSPFFIISRAEAPRPWSLEARFQRVLPSEARVARRSEEGRGR
jgi:uncharacterized protein (DUF1330 family)